MQHNEILLNELNIEKLRSRNGGWSSRITIALGVGWPLLKGWKYRLIEQKIKMPVDEFNELVRIKDLHLNKKSITKEGEALKCTAKSGVLGRNKSGVLVRIKNRKSDFTYKDTWKTRKKRLDEMGLKDYGEFLKSDHWKKIRIKAFERPEYRQCKKCNSGSNIVLHHTSYKFLGLNNELQNVIPLCPICCAAINYLAKSKNISIRIATKRYEGIKSLKAILKDYLLNRDKEINALRGSKGNLK